MAEMVVEAFLSSLFGVVLERLASRDLIDYFRRVKLDALVENLQSILNSINQVLDDAEKKQYENPDVKTWLGDVKHAMYEADQLLDEIATDAPLKKMRVETQPSTSSIFNFIPTFINPFKSRLNELIKSLDCLAEQKDKLELKKGAWAHNGVGVGSRPLERLPTTYLVDTSQIYGRDADKDEMIKFLLSRNGNDNQVPVVSIVGLGGMGKTTFAKLVYNEHVIEEHFDLKAWVHVSEPLDVAGLTKHILKSFHPSSDNESVINILQQRLQQRLSGKKYLLVLDDIWNKNEESIEQLLLPFNHGFSGSKIIVTTRDKEVANVLKSIKLFDLQQLEKNDCWSLFLTHAFRGKNACEYPNFESIGKKIVDKCGGLPLAVKTLGQLLRKKFSQHEWMKILETDMWCLFDGDNNINPVLRLSYHNLPSNQKRCFAYCSIFRKGYRFRKDELIKLWMAEGLLKCCGTDKCEEELGNEILGDLVSISFFQQSSYRKFRRYHHEFVMHDLVNDLAKSVSGGFCMQIEGARMEGIFERTRHIRCSLQINCVDKLLKPICELKGLRSLILEGYRAMFMSNNVQHDLFSRLKCLRMLSFRYCGLLELVDEISNLKLLRYLDLSSTEITRLPDTICMLYNLQTLLLKDCCKLTELPSKFSKLIHLRHLELPFRYIKKMPENIGNLNSLQTLPYFIVEEHDGSDIKELEKLNHLHGTIHIKGLGKVIDPADAVTANLKDKKYLEEIQMTFNGGKEEIDDGSIVENSVSVLEALQPNSNLKMLIIKKYNGNKFPNWVRGCHLPNLISLELQYCGLCFHLPLLGQLPLLKELSISVCKGIKIIGEEFYGNNSTNVPFKSLEVLEFESMINWEEWFCLEGFPLLKTLSLRYCPKLKRALPQRLPSLLTLEICDCKELEASALMGGLPSNLRYLEISNCPKLIASREEWGLFQLNFLKEFRVSDEFENAESFPEENLLPPTLKSLHLKKCSKLRVMNYKGLPNSLETLYINKCPLLKEPYRKDEGERWHTISHIPSVKID